MPFELSVLVVIAAFYWGLGQVTGVAKTRVAGTAWNLGNRETEPPTPPWVGRTERAQRNLLESFPLFASLVITLALTQRFSTLTHVATGIFATARFAHAGLFMAGITFWRSIAYLASLVGLGLLGLALFV